GGSGEDILDGNDGNDTIETGDGSDTIIDSDGDDLYIVSAGDRIELNSGSDRIEFDDDKVASSGDTSTTFILELPSYVSSSDISLTRDSADSDYINVAYGGQDADFDARTTPILDFGGSAFAINEFTLTTNGTDGNDTIFDYFSGFTSNIQNDIIYGHGGNDGITVINGGDDIVYGGAGNDAITQTQLFTPVTVGSVKFYGEEGDDTLSILGSLSGELYGGSGNDTLFSSVNSDYLDGGTGNDLIYAGAGNDEIHGGDGDDTILQLDGGSKTVYAEGGDDLIYLDIIADDVIDGGEGLDSLSFENISVVDPSVIDLANQTATINSVVYTFTSIEGVFGTVADDTIIGNIENNILFGGNGDGVTFLGNDTLRGGAGDDIYFVGSSLEFKPLPNQPVLPAPVIGSDIIDDSSGDADAIEFTAYYNLADLTFMDIGNNLVITFAEGDITIQNHFGGGKVEELILSNGLTLDMDDYEDWSVGDETDNTLVATSANEALYGGNGNDDLTAHINGGKLYGGAGIDTLTGVSGNDTLTGGVGDDFLNGGAGNDTYVFNLGDGNNTITDTSGFDVLKLGAGIALGDITFTQVGNDLDVQIASGFLIKNFYAGNSVEEIRFNDGSIFNMLSLLGTTPVDTGDPLSFTEIDFVSYTNQDKVNNTFVVSNDTELHLAGNNWKSLDFDYTVTDNTYVQLDYQTVVQGEIQGLIFLEQGLNVNAGTTVHDNEAIIRLDGYQAISSGQETLYSEPIGTWQTITIKLSDYNGVGSQIDNLVFINDDDDDKTGDALFRDIRVFEDNTDIESVDAMSPLGFTETDFVSYTNQDKVNNTFAVTNNTELHLVGNNWKSLDFDYVVTGNSYVQFDYQTVVQGEIQGLIFLEQGLDVNSSTTVHDNEAIIRLDGDQAISSGQETLYSEPVGTWQTITVKLSDYNMIGSQIDNLVFVNDDDDNKTGDALFRDIRVFEEGSGVTDTLNGSAFNETLFGRDGADTLYGHDGDDVLYGGAGVDMLYGQSGADTFVFDDTASSDNVQDFNLAEGDKFDVSDLLSGYDPLTDAISDFVHITESGSNSYLSVDADGGADNFIQVAYLYNATGITDEEALETSGNLIAA
ncbi:MAG: type I secretion C-terminal target domain-containing protein, partial [Proteobacteria bacterium]|nr:type I secretion C-terminal target domain-containing protein [Pseudomonadota bacterium]